MNDEVDRERSVGLLEQQQRACIREEHLAMEAMLERLRVAQEDWNEEPDTPESDEDFALTASYIIQDFRTMKAKRAKP